MAEKKKEVSLQNHRAMIELPEDALEVELNIKVWHNGEVINVTNTLTLTDLRTAFRKADDGYIDEDDRFVLTDRGKAIAEELS